MSNVYLGYWGAGVLGPFQSSTWSAEINAGSVWHFWVDNTTLGYQPSRVRIHFIDTFRAGNSHRVEVTIRNPFFVAASYALRWSVVYD